MEINVASVTSFGGSVVDTVTFVSPTFNFTFTYLLSQIRPEGMIVYEYNPFRNYRLAYNQEIDGVEFEPGMLVDLVTDQLNFSLNNPVDITIQPSYDGSVNLILNDDRNPPRLINSRFTALSHNTYKIIDRSGSNDTNIYDEDQFDLDTSLYKRVTTIPNVDFIGLDYGGNLKVGNYVFYFKYCDADGNETEFVEESGIVTCHIGNISDPFSIRGGLYDENSYKSVLFTLTNTDPSYNYIVIYYTRSTSGEDGAEITTAHRIDKRYLIRGDIATITITGNEKVEDKTLEDINAQYFIASAVKAQAQAQNMLFFGNVFKPEIPYKELTDLSLRFYPFYAKDTNIGYVEPNYVDNRVAPDRFEYYNARNIYYNLGYWNKEIYRFGVVYILNDNTLSPVFNIRGRNSIPSINSSFDYTWSPLYDDEGERQYIEINEETFLIENSTALLENSKGVVRIEDNSITEHTVFNLAVKIEDSVIEEIRKYAKGFFLVRQKRVPTILAQALVVGLDAQSCIPVLKDNTNYFAESFIDVNGKLTQDYNDRLRYLTGNVSPSAAICPEYELKQPYFNTLFTGTDFYLEEAEIQPVGNGLSINSERSYYIPGYAGASTRSSFTSKLTAVGDNIQLISDGTQRFRSRAGQAEEAWKFEFLQRESLINYNNTRDNNIVRGAFGPYIGLSNYTGVDYRYINIYIPGYTPYNMSQYFDLRYDDSSAYYAIGKRLDLDNFITNDFETATVGNNVTIRLYKGNFFRGDCFICNYTHRMNRNFEDPEAPTNDVIVNPDTWKQYESNKTDNYADINRGDVNAIELGHWVTFKVYSSVNLSMRTTDTSNVTEAAMFGQPRAFFPLYSMSPKGEAKIPESFLMNEGINSTTSDKYNYEVPDVPYIKNEFDTRIIYSDISVNDAFKNGYRVFQLNHYRDYPKVYGGIMRMIELFGNILCIFEHGVALIPVNERTIAGEGAGGTAYINTSNVLPENPKMLSDRYGSQWPESIIKTPYFVYGIDTVAKKIWRTNGSQFEVISEFVIQEFMNENITLTERELTPIIGVRNVKSHYNAFKEDVMFTFYDNLYGFEEKVWNICYNERLQKWITFYSWVPSYSENIDNLHFTFNRNTSKWIAKLGTSQEGSTNADGVTLSTVVFTDNTTTASLSLTNRAIPDDDNTGITLNDYVYTLEKDNFGNYKYFEIVDNVLSFTGTTEELESKAVWLLNIKVDITIQDYTGTDTNILNYINGWKEYTETNYGYYQSVVAVTSETVLNNPMLTDEDKSKPSLTTDFWKHGKAGIIDIADKLKPAFWYGEQHPFEFEFVVVTNPGDQKIYNNLQIISNKAMPESFHYEVVGEGYEFHDDKFNIYYRQEATKALYQNLGSDILFNRNYLDVTPIRQIKSTILPLYYERIDTFNEIYDYYQLRTAPNKDYQNLTGSEIVFYPKLDEFRVWAHSKAVDTWKTSRLRGNCQYQEDKWIVVIDPLIFIQKNESDWSTVPTIVLDRGVPEDLTSLEIEVDDLPPGYTSLDQIQYAPSTIDIGWTDRKNSKVRDKYVKIRIRYKGDELAKIIAVKTLYTTSYA